MYSISKEVTNEENKLYFTISENVNESKVINMKNWNLEIPKIDLYAEIVEGVGSDTLNLNIGHFNGTGIVDKNICLAAHNRGYNVNYFSRIKELENGDEIYYTYNGVRKKYIVNSKIIIKDTEWKYLENTEINESIISNPITPKYSIVPVGTKVVIVNGSYGDFGTGFRDLKSGMYGSDVMQIQKKLILRLLN